MPSQMTNIFLLIELTTHIQTLQIISLPDFPGCRIRKRRNLTISNHKAAVRPRNPVRQQINIVGRHHSLPGKIRNQILENFFCQFEMIKSVKLINKQECNPLFMLQPIIKQTQCTSTAGSGLRKRNLLSVIKIQLRIAVRILYSSQFNRYFPKFMQELFKIPNIPLPDNIIIYILMSI